MFKGNFMGAGQQIMLVTQGVIQEVIQEVQTVRQVQQSLGVNPTLAQLSQSLNQGQ